MGLGMGHYFEARRDDIDKEIDNKLKDKKWT